MTTEAKVGAFVIAGLTLVALAIFLLGDFTFERRYTVYVTFTDVAGLVDETPVKLSGVEVGKVKRITLEGQKAKVEASIRRGVPIYRDATFTVGSTGIIGSKFLQIDQGKPESGELPEDSVVEGVDPVSIEKALAKALGSLQELLGGLDGEGKQGMLARNLNDTVANMRSITSNIDEMFADTKPHLTRALDRMDGITAKLDSILSKTDQMMAAINQGKGPIGALMHDEQMKDEVKQTVTNLKETVGNVKDVLGRINQFRVYWNYDWRYEHEIRASRGDIGLTIEPRADRYYYVGGSNLGNNSDSPRGDDFARKNTVDALLGFRWGGVDLGAGILRSAGGARLTVTPFKGRPILGRFSAFGQGYDFGRNRVYQSRQFTRPQYDVGAMLRLHRLVGVGGRVEDLSEVKRYQSWVNVSFEDTDIAYLFGLVSFGAAGTRGRSKSN